MTTNTNLAENAIEEPQHPATKNFRWPSPPYSSLPSDIEQTEPEPCRLTLRNGTDITARMTFFIPEEGVLQYQIPPSRTAVTLAFEDLKILRLLRPLTTKGSAPLFPPDLAGCVTPVPDKQQFRLEFIDGDRRAGLTLGYVREPFGLFLFQPGKEAGQVHRRFFPTSAIRKFRVGGLMGQFLVQENLVSERALAQAVDKQDELRKQRLGDQLVQANIATPDDLLQAVRHQASAPLMRLGEALIELGLLTDAQLHDALERQRSQRSKQLGQILVELGFLSVEALQLALARKLGVPLVQLENFPIQDAALKAIPYSVAQRLRVIPLLVSEGRLLVAVEDPWRNEALEELKFVTQLKVVPVMTAVGSVHLALQRCYFEGRVEALNLAGGDSHGAGHDEAAAIEFTSVSEIAGELTEKAVGEESEDRQVQESDTALVRLVNSMVLDAYRQNVSDIHIETYPDQQKTRIRFRKDGALVPYLELPASYRKAVVSRIKVMAELDISERRKPQDGKIDFARYAQAKLELRVATIPTNNGLEDVVIRLLVSARPVPLEKLRLSDANLKDIQAIMTRPYGLFLLCGPTGSGKTTTLHSCLSYINVPERKIWTAEDPIEITQPGLRQVQVQPKIGWTFGAAMRAFLRADPDVIMVGEMRDTDTARTGVEASLTGHLVLSTLHTNGSAESVTRLLDMGLDPFNFSDSLLGILAQRLVRKLCPDCRTSHIAEHDELEELLDDYCHEMPAIEGFSREFVLADWQKRFADDAGNVLVHKSAGCSKCSGTGYKGRVAIHELLVSTRKVKRIIQTGGRVEEIQKAALEQGMRTLKQDGIEKILMGLTDLHEVRSVSN
jgi:type II secretory ATPase GspE/PulE/Tfp pilus assembly ATPase PilB-like protein